MAVFGVGFPNMLASTLAGNIGGAVSAAPGIWDKLKGLLGNPALIQMLGAAGSDLLGNTPGKNTGQVIQQGALSQAFGPLLQKILSGEMEGAKATLGEGGMKMSIPSKHLGSLSGSDIGANGGSRALPETEKLATSLGGFNPFGKGLSGISASDLAGLTPELITQALQFKFAQSQFGQKTAEDVMDFIMKGAQLEEQARGTDVTAKYYDTLAKHYEASDATGMVNAYRQWISEMKGDALDRPFPIPGPNETAVTNRQWNSLPDEEQDYLLAKHYGGDSVPSKDEWLQMRPTERGRLLRDLLSNEDLRDLDEKLRESSAIRLTTEQKVQEKIDLSKASGQVYFNDPDWQDDVAKHLGEEEVRSRISLSENSEDTTEDEVVKYIESKIRVGGTILKDPPPRWVGNTLVWTVKWNSGETSNVTYDFGPRSSE